MPGIEIALLSTAKHHTKGTRSSRTSTDHREFTDHTTEKNLVDLIQLQYTAPTLFQSSSVLESVTNSVQGPVCFNKVVYLFQEFSKHQDSNLKNND